MRKTCKWETRVCHRGYGLRFTRVPCTARKASLLWTLNTLHKRGAPRSGLNDEKELGHVANAGTVPADVHARVGREKK